MPPTAPRKVNMSLLLTAKVKCDEPRQKMTYSFAEIGKILGRHRHRIGVYHRLLMLYVPEYRESFRSKRTNKLDIKRPKTRYHLWAIAKVKGLFDLKFNEETIKDEIKSYAEEGCLSFQAFKEDFKNDQVQKR